MLLATACGGRTGLFVIEQDAGRPMDGSRPPPDSTVPPVDAGQDTSPDAEPDVGPDVLPPIDAMFSDVVMVNNCPDAGATLIYVLTATNQLFSFYPPTQVFTFIGTIACPTAPNFSPFSMAVDRTGTAFSVFTDNNLYQLDTATAACVSTPFVPGQNGFSTFGMGFVSDTNDTGETLFVADSAFNTTGRGNSMGIASIDTMAFALNFVGPFTPAIPGPELTGTGDGRLFGFYTNQVGTGSHIVEIDKTTGNLLADNPLQVGNPNDAYAFAFWGGSFWVFTSQGMPSPTQVTQFNPADMSETPMTTMSGTIVGAGVSTCAPQ